jgi:hypothetical protein
MKKIIDKILAILELHKIANKIVVNENLTNNIKTPNIKTDVFKEIKKELEVTTSVEKNPVQNYQLKTYSELSLEYEAILESNEELKSTILKYLKTKTKTKKKNKKKNITIDHIIELINTKTNIKNSVNHRINVAGLKEVEIYKLWDIISKFPGYNANFYRSNEAPLSKLVLDRIVRDYTESKNVLVRKGDLGLEFQKYNIIEILGMLTID